MPRKVGGGINGAISIGKTEKAVELIIVVIATY
jgi:hypothetical protein